MLMSSMDRIFYHFIFHRMKNFVHCTNEKKQHSLFVFIWHLKIVERARSVECRTHTYTRCVCVLSVVPVVWASVQWTKSYGSKIPLWMDRKLHDWWRHCKWTEWSISNNQSNDKDLSMYHISNIIERFDIVE